MIHAHDISEGHIGWPTQTDIFVFRHRRQTINADGLLWQVEQNSRIDIGRCAHDILESPIQRQGHGGLRPFDRRPRLTRNVLRANACQIERQIRGWIVNRIGNQTLQGQGLHARLRHGQRPIKPKFDLRRCALWFSRMNGKRQMPFDSLADQTLEIRKVPDAEIQITQRHLGTVR